MGKGGYTAVADSGSKVGSYVPPIEYSPSMMNQLGHNTYNPPFSDSSLPHKYTPSHEGLYQESFENQLYNYLLEKYSPQLKSLSQQYKEMFEKGDVYKAAYYVLKDVYAQNKGESKLKTKQDIQFFYDLMKLYVLGSYQHALSNEEKEFLFYEAAPLYLDNQGLLPPESLAVAVSDPKYGYSIIIKDWLASLSNHKPLMEVLAHEYIHILQYYTADKYYAGKLPDEQKMEAQATLHSLELLRKIDENYKSLADPSYIAWAKEYAKQVGINPAWIDNPELEKYSTQHANYKRPAFNPEYYDEKEPYACVNRIPPIGTIKKPSYKKDDIAVNRGVLH